jgi:hypothetical protein
MEENRKYPIPFVQPYETPLASEILVCQVWFPQISGISVPAVAAACSPGGIQDGI